MTPPADLKDRLQALGAASTRSGARRMADVLPEIESALSSGAPRSAVVQALNDHGIPMTLTTFATNLYRLRRAALRQPGIAPRPAGRPVVAPPGTDPPHRYGQHDPRRLDDVMRSTPDLAALARLGKENRR